MLRQEYEKPNRRQPGLAEMQKILLSSLASYDRVFLHLDALDECPDSNGARMGVLEGIDHLLGQASNLRLLATSRNVPDVYDYMEELGAASLSIAASAVGADIERFISTQLSRNRRLSRLDSAMKAFIQQTLSEEANGMFMWVSCQLQELSKSKWTGPNSIKAALFALPETLDGLYERMLNGIGTDDRSRALTLIRWLAYAETPLSLGELAEASIIVPNDGACVDGTVDTENRGDWTSVLDILADLLVTIEKNEQGRDDTPMGSRILYDTDEINSSDRKIGNDTEVRLARFSIKEYLESSRILQSSADPFHLDPAREHRFLTRSCLLYLSYYSDSSKRVSDYEDLKEFPLLNYASNSWFHHARLQQSGRSHWELSFLASDTPKEAWLRVYNPHIPMQRPFRWHMTNVDGPLLYSSALGLESAVLESLDAGADVNIQGGLYGNALQAAPFKGYERVVKILLNHSANVNSQGGYCGNALQAASCKGYERIVWILLDHGADVNTQGSSHGTALFSASTEGHERIVEILLHHGADINTQRDHHGNALYAASERGHESVVKLLLDHGADINTQGGLLGTALSSASAEGHERIAEVLLDRGADVNAQSGSWTALSVASDRGRDKVVQTLLKFGADVNGQFGRSALSRASNKGHQKVVQILLDHGATPTSQKISTTRLWKRHRSGYGRTNIAEKRSRVSQISDE